MTIVLPDEFVEIHTTDRGTFKKCRQMWEFVSNIRYNLEPTRPQDELWLGTAFHEGIGAYYDPATPRTLEVATDWFKFYVDTWRKEYEDLTERDLSEDMLDWLDGMLELGLAMIEQYVDYAENDPERKDKKLFKEVLWVEREFHIPLYDEDGNQMIALDGLPIVYSFRVDGLVKDSKGRIWILELKSTKQFFSDYEWLLMDDQPGSYLWGMHQLEEFKDMKIEGVIYSYVRKKVPTVPALLKPTKKEPIIYSVAKNQDTTYEIAKKTFVDAFGKKLDQKYKDFLAFLKDKPNNFVQREIVRRNPKEIANLGQAIRFEVWEMTNDPSIYRTPSSFNCSRCAFVGPCIARWEGSDYESMLTSGLYQERQKPLRLRMAS